LQYFRAFHAYINGTKGATKKKLENETGTTIDIPKKGKDGDISNNNFLNIFSLYIRWNYI